MAVIRIPLEIDASQAQDSLRVIRRDLATLEREAKAKAKSIGQSLNGSFAAMRGGRFPTVARTEGPGSLFHFAAAEEGNLKTALKKLGSMPRTGRKGGGDRMISDFARFQNFEFTKKNLEEFSSALEDFSKISGLIGKDFSTKVRLAQKIAADLGVTGSLVLDEFTRVAVQNFDLLKNPKALEAEARTGIELDRRVDQDDRSILGLNRSLNKKIVGRIDQFDKDIVDPFLTSRVRNQEKGLLDFKPPTLGDQLENTITRLEHGQPFGRADENIMQSALGRLQDIREQMAKIKTLTGNLDVDRTDLEFDSPRNSQRIFRITTVMDTLDIRKNNLAKEAQAINTQLQDFMDIRREIDDEGNLSDLFSGASGGLKEQNKALNEFNGTTLKTVESISFQREAMNGLLTPLTGLTEGTGSLTAAVKKNSSAFDEARTKVGDFKTAAKETKTVLDALAESSDQLGQAVGNAFEDAVVNGKDLRSVLKALEKDLLRILLKEFGVTGKGGIFSTILKDVLGGFKVKDPARTTLTSIDKFNELSPFKGIDDSDNSFTPFGADEADIFGDLSSASRQLAGNFGLTSAASKIAGNALQTSAVDTLTAAAKTTFLGLAEQNAASSIFELAVAARVASSALNSVGASKGGGGLGGGLGGLFGSFGSGGSANVIGAGDASGFLGAGAGFNVLGGGVGGLVFSHGGRFTVRGPAGIDNLLTPLRLTAGERVTVETPAQQKTNDQGTTINNYITMNITTPDSGGFRKSQNQIVADLQRALDRARRIQ